MEKISMFFAFALITLVSMTAQNNKLSPSTNAFLSERAEKVEVINHLYRTTSVDNVEYVSGYIHFNGAIDIQLLENYFVIVGSQFENKGIVTAQIPVDVINDLSKEASIKYIEMGLPVSQNLSKARVAARVDKVVSGLAPLTQGYTGEGVIVGICDIGFEYDHITFTDSSRKLRVKRVWNQSSKFGDRPEGFTYGAEYKTEADIKDAKYDNRFDEVGHGTHVAGIAAGADRNNGKSYQGVATESELVFVSVNMSSDPAIVDAAKYIFNYADEQDKPAVLNFSLGGHFGPHDGTSTFDVLCDELQGPGRLIVGAAGNEGSDKIHVSKALTSPQDTLKTLVKFLNSKQRYTKYDFWGDTTGHFTVQVIVIDKFGGNKEIYKTGYYSTSTVGTNNIPVEIKDDNNTVVIKGTVSITTQDSSILNGKPNAIISMNMSTFPGSGKYIGIKISGSGTIHGWSVLNETGAFDRFNIPGWQDGDQDCTVGEIGGTGNRIITAGAYTTDDRNGMYGQTMGKHATFSSHGPTADGRVKPDISAPGAVLLSALPNISNVVNTLIDSHETNTVGGRDYIYGWMQGTSQAAPMVTGILATWLQADATLTPERVREVFDANSIRDSHTGDQFPNNLYGYGKINAFAGLTYILGLTTDNDNVEHAESMMAYPNPTSGEFNIGFVKEDTNVSVEIFDITGKKVYTELIPSVSAGTTQVFSLADVTNGVYVVRLKGDATSNSFRLVVSK